MRQVFSSSSLDAVPPIATVVEGGVGEEPTPITDQMESWEIEFLASKVYDFIRHKLTLEQERYGRPGFGLWA